MGLNGVSLLKKTAFSFLMWILFPDEEVARFTGALANKKFIRIVNFRKVRSMEENLFVVKDKSL